MKIAQYYQSLLEEEMQAVKSMEPITFCGMYDSGIDYIFSLSLPLLQAEYRDTHLLLSIDLSGLDTPESIETELSYTLSEYDTSISGNLGYFGITTKIKHLANSKPVHLIIYGGQEGTLDKSCLILLNRLRNLLGWKFSYSLYISAKNILSHNNSLLSKKVIYRNLVWVLPLNQENAEVVIRNYEERYQFKPSKLQKNKLISLSGGNPGLIKALYLILKNEPTGRISIHDAKLTFRLQGIIGDLGELKNSNPPVEHIYTELGYTNEHKEQRLWFTDLINQYLEQPNIGLSILGRTVNQRQLSMTISQRNLLNYLEANQGVVISRESLAQAIWGEQWDTKYSDWAIDQMISTLRKKMESIKYNGTLVTKRGEGITFITGN